MGIINPRGARAFNAFVNDQVESNQVKNYVGRNPALISARNELIANRYYFYAKLSTDKLSFNEVLARLSNEFFLSRIQISKIIHERHSTLVELKKKEATVKQISQQYPFFSWR